MKNHYIIRFICTIIVGFHIKINHISYSPTFLVLTIGPDTFYR